MDNKTILIVDDTYENRYLSKVILEEAGFEVIEANDGNEGLKKLHEIGTIDLIISDILMPIMDGYLFCQACKKEKILKKIPFVFYTSAYTEKLDEDFAMALGAVKYLRKPIDPDELLFSLNQILDSHEVKEQNSTKESISNDEVLRLYSQRLIHKLEQKSLDLGNEVLERKRAEQLLIQKNDILDLIAVNTPLNKIFDQLILNYEVVHKEYYGAISLLNQDGIHLDLVAAPSMPKEYNLAVKQFAIGPNVGSFGAAAFTKKPAIVSDISKDKLWVNYKDLALKHNLKSCWSVPILSKNNDVLGIFAIYSEAISTPSLEQIRELNFAVGLANIAIEKTRIVAEIKKKDESYKALVDQATDAIITYSLDGTIYSFNKASHINLGYTRKEFLKLKIQDIIVGDIITNQDTHKLLLQEKSVIFDRQLIRKDKSIITVEISAKMQKDGRILGIGRDITEWQNNVKEIKKEREFSAGLLNAMQEGLVVRNVEGEIISVNASFCKITGFAEHELIGQTSPYPFSTPESISKEIEYLKISQKDELSNGFETLYKRKSGTRFPVHILVSSLYDAEGNKTANFGTVQDITARVKAEIDLKLAKQFTDKLIMSMQEGLLIVNLESEIIMINEATCNMLGYSENELIGLKLPYPFAEIEDFGKILMTNEKAEIGKAPFYKFEFTRKSGEKFFASFLAGNIKNDKGEVIALFGTMKDISEEEKAKKLLQENAIKSNQKKNVILQLASLVGKEFKPSLRIITNLAAKTLEVNRVSVWSFNADKSQILCEKLYILDKNTFESGQILKCTDNPNYFNALNKSQTIRIQDAQNDAITKLFANDYLKPNGITSLMDVFVNSNHGYYGIMCFEHVGSVLRDWTADEQVFATSIANIVSLMVESTERKLAETKVVIANEQLTLANKELNVLRNQLEQENVYLRTELDLVFNYEEMVYGSAAFSNVLTEVEKVAPTTATVLLLGESGTGKELLARAIHNTSLRNNKPLIKVNCSAIPRELIESELFGHKKGSFTGAYNDRIGKFELADGGTLFLDEIGELPLDMQPKLLRFLQEGEIEVVGGSVIKKLDVRVIAATNKNLKEEIERKQFREDLYFRLNVFPIEVPPLRQRKDDIPLLVEHFVDKFNKAYGKTIKFITDDAMSKLKVYKWPGNIRELENLIERAVILSTSETLIIPGFESSNQNIKSLNDKDLSLDTVQRNHILQVLEKCNWKISGANGASIMLKLKPSTLRDKMAKLGIEK